MADFVGPSDNNDLRAQIAAYLAQRDRTPTVQNIPFENGLRGVFQYGEGVPKAGLVDLYPSSDYNTYIHELAHAADRQLLQQAYSEKKTNTQFSEGWEKLRGGMSTPDLVEKLAPGWRSSETSYRAFEPEVTAFAAGNAAAPAGRNQSPPHVDATLATELAILLDLASRKNK